MRMPLFRGSNRQRITAVGEMLGDSHHFETELGGKSSFIVPSLVRDRTLVSLEGEHTLGRIFGLKGASYDKRFDQDTADSGVILPSC